MTKRVACPLTDAQLKGLGVNRKARRALRFGHGDLMAKVDPFALPRLKRPVDTREFAADGPAISLTLQPAGLPDEARAMEIAEQLTRDYITGSEDRAAADFPEGVKVSRALFQICSLLAERQYPENPADAYTAIELAIFSDKRPRDWRQIMTWSTTQQTQWSSRQGESPGPPSA
jgi:hypothetical protein